jgi:hypothetical protein
MITVWVGVLALSFHRLHNDLNELYGLGMCLSCARDVMVCIVMPYLMLYLGMFALDKIMP